LPLPDQLAELLDKTIFKIILGELPRPRIQIWSYIDEESIWLLPILGQRVQVIRFGDKSYHFAMVRAEAGALTATGFHTDGIGWFVQMFKPVVRGFAKVVQWLHAHEEKAKWR
jgi:hypothetical protein